jgi:DNA-binding LacI/PurR family transcriptional regulator
MDKLGLYGSDLAREAHVAEATVSRALNGRPIQPATFRAIVTALAALDPVPGADGLIDLDGEP